MAISEATYRAISLEDDDEVWELVRGTLRKKPLMSVWHGNVSVDLILQLGPQLDENEYALRANHARARISGGTWFVPDVAVIPVAAMREHFADPGALDAYEDPLPFVAELWSKSTGDYDASDKLSGYQERGDQEIWLVHPYERRVRVFTLQSDGSYLESVHSNGSLALTSLPNVRIDIDRLFRRPR